MRPALERLCKAIIYDVLEDDVLAAELISGQKDLRCDNSRSCCNLENTTTQSKEGASLAFLAQRVILYKRPQLFNEEKTIKRIRRGIENTCREISNWYGEISGTGNHSANEKDAKIQSDTLVNIIQVWIKNLKSVISPELGEILVKLPIPKEVELPSQSEKCEEESNDFAILDELTHHLEQIPGVNYVAILPESLKDKHGQNLSNSQLQEFFRLQWNFVIDLNKKTIDGLFEQAPSGRKSSLRIITDNFSEVSGVSNMTNWLFAKGRLDLSAYDDKKALRDTPRLFSKVFSKIVRTGLTNDYLIFDFCDSFPDLSIRLFDNLEDVFGSWEAVSSRCKIISFTNNIEYIEKLKQWNEIYEVPIYFIRATFGDFVNHISQVKPAIIESVSSRLLVRGNTKDLTESRERYRAAGIEFHGPTVIKEERKWDFYSGAEITWEELDNQCDVQRDIYRIVKQRVSEIIRTTRRTSVYTLRHRPGSGATTLSRRLGYDIKKEDEIGLISCTVIDIKNCSNIRLTEQYLCQLSEVTDNVAILAFVESKRVGREKFDNLVKRMSDAAKKIVFFYIEPFTGRYHTPKENVILLDSYLINQEQQRFEEKYKQLGLSNKLLQQSKKLRQRLEVIDFPLMLRDNETSNNLSSYVNEWTQVLPENLKLFCAYVGFVFKYSDLGVNQVLLKSIWNDREHTSLRAYSQEQQNAIGKLLIEEYSDDGNRTGVWRPRYNRFSTFLLESYKQNWISGLSELAKDFIKLCKEAGELGSDDKDMLYSVFIIRKNADYRAIEDKANFKNKFSLLIKDLEDIERAESLFSTLVESFPDDAIFRGHFARFLYEKASMIKDISVDDRLFDQAQSNLDEAFAIKPNDSDLHHMQGMLFRRKIYALSRQFSRDMNEDSDAVDVKDVEDCLIDWTGLAYNAFEISIQLSPASPYGYAAESQLFKEAINFGKKILQCNDYSFCETSSIYSDYTEKLGNVLDLLEQICYTFKNDGLTQIMNSLPIYETVRAFHQNIVGQNSESIKRYRSKFSSSTGDKKALYGSLLVKSIIYSKTDTRDTRRAYSNLTRQEKQEIETVLEYQKNQGDIKSYETLFMLKLYSPEEFSLDEAIDLLKEWERQYTDHNQSGWGYLSACFYLAVCYCSKSIQGKVPNKELTQLAMTYFKRSEDIAKKFDKGTIQPQCYFGEKSDIHCIVDKYRKDMDAGTITGVIIRINNNKGILKMQCGIDVTFNAKGFDTMRDEGQSLRGVLGFSYSGPGLYDFYPENNLSSDVIDIQEEKEVSFEELNQSYAPVEDLVEEPQNDNIQDVPAPASDAATIKVVGQVDLESVHRPKKNTLGIVDTSVENGMPFKASRLLGKINGDMASIYSDEYKRWFTIEMTDGFKKDYSPNDYDYRINELVFFDLIEIKKPGTHKLSYRAVNVSPASIE